MTFFISLMEKNSNIVLQGFLQQTLYVCLQSTNNHIQNAHIITRICYFHQNNFETFMFKSIYIHRKSKYKVSGWNLFFCKFWTHSCFVFICIQHNTYNLHMLLTTLCVYTLQFAGNIIKFSSN